MTDVTSSKSARRPHHWRRDLVELAALFTAVAVADAVANTVAHGPDGPFLLVASAVALIVTAGFHLWWSRRHSHHGHAPPAEGPPVATPAGTIEDLGTDADGATALWRMRATVRDAPGSLAALCTVLAGRRVDILTLQTHPLATGTVDEFLLRAPASLSARQLSREISLAGGGDIWIERADTHDLVDAPTRILGLATRTALDAAELPLALRQLLGRCTIHSLPAVSPTGGPTGESAPVEGILEGTTMRMRDPNGGVISVERHYLPFTP
ncbi:GNAT family N-acetyltransferase, partial [Streptomyces niveus]